VLYAEGGEGGQEGEAEPAIGPQPAPKGFAKRDTVVVQTTAADLVRI
jgi:hypothetical protein